MAAASLSWRFSQRLHALLLLSLPSVRSDESADFARDLERCIREHAAVAAARFTEYGDSCLPPTEKIDRQAVVYEETLKDIHAKYGYTGALWCAFYSLRMTGREYDPNDTQPNNPNFSDWYASLLCPWNLEECGYAELGTHGDEWNGVSVEGAPNQNAQYLTTPLDEFVPDEPDRRTMSCGLCGHLQRKLGDPPFIVEPEPVSGPNAALFTANWDFHPFGAWLANDAAANGGDVDDIVKHINIWRASNGEEIHGFLWQSTRLLAHETGTLAGERRELVDEATAVDHVMRVCKPSWWLAPQSRDDCSHAAGHGFFYYFLDIGRAASACWSDKIIDYTPGRELDRDADTRHSGLSAADLLKWRWLCSTGVYHASGNTLSLEILDRIAQSGEGGAEDFLCKRSNLWGEDARYFDRCAAGLGIKETEGRLELVRSGQCVPRLVTEEPRVTAEPAAWELRQLQQFGQTQQLSCNPAKYFVQANDQCPLAFRAHFPCEFGTKDYDFCTGRLGGAIVKGPDGPRGIIHEVPGAPPAFLDFFTIKIVTPLTADQLAQIPADGWAFFDAATNTGLLKYEPAKVRAQFVHAAEAELSYDRYNGPGIFGATAGRRLQGVPNVLVKVLDTELEEDDHVILTSLYPLTLDNTAKVTPYHELCMSHQMLRETFRCETPRPPPSGHARVNYAVGFKLGYPLGVWGGTCTVRLPI